MVPVVTALLADDEPPNRGTIVAIDAAAAGAGVEAGEVDEVQPMSKIPTRQTTGTYFITTPMILGCLIPITSKYKARIPIRE